MLLCHSSQEFLVCLGAHDTSVLDTEGSFQCLSGMQAAGVYEVISSRARQCFLCGPCLCVLSPSWAPLCWPHCLQWHNTWFVSFPPNESSVRAGAVEPACESQVLRVVLSAYLKNHQNGNDVISQSDTTS